MKPVIDRRLQWTDTGYSDSRNARYERRKRREDPAYRQHSLEYQRQWLAARPGYRKLHPGKKRVRSKEYRRLQYQKHKLRRAQNPILVIAARLRARLNTALRVNLARKAYNTQALLGCNFTEFSQYLQSKWLPGMSWANRHEWHIDHIKPVASFNLLDPEQQKLCFHYTNLQPLWKLDNLKKADKVAA